MPVCPECGEQIPIQKSLARDSVEKGVTECASCGSTFERTELERENRELLFK